MDENYNEENFDEQQNMNRRNDTGVVGRLNQFSSGFKAGMFGSEDKTKERINNRGKNETERGIDKENGKLDKEDTGQNKNGLEKKDELEKKDNNNKENDNKSNKPTLPGKLGETSKKALDVAAKAKNMKLLLLKLKIIGIAIGIFAGIFIIMYIFTVLDNFFSSIVLNYLVPEQKEDNLEGLYTDSKYIRDPDTGEMYTWPELIKVLNNDDACDPNLFQKVIESIFGYGENFTDECQFMRYIKKQIEKYEENYMERKKNEPNKLDRGLILATLFYGYDSQATYDNYENPPAKSDDKGDTYISASDHYEALRNIVKDGKLTKTDVDRIIQSTIFEDVYPSFSWEIKVRIDPKTKKEIRTGYCNVDVVQNYQYSRDKWEMFIRWNDEKDLKSGEDTLGSTRSSDFSVPGYIKIGSTKLLDSKMTVNGYNVFLLSGTGYTYDTSMNNAWKTTYEECNGTISEDELKSMYDLDEVDGSVEKAHHYFIDREYTQIVDTTIYFQKVENITGTTKDVFESRNIKYTVPQPKVGTTYVEFEYKHGFGYINFPSFKQADEDTNLPAINYNDATTPKKIEEIIEEIKNRKTEINNVLLLKDLDSQQYGENGYWDEDGNYIPGTVPNTDNENVTTNAYCKEYLSAIPDDITVELTDCDGVTQESVSFKEYIIGTLKGEIDNSTNKNYALTQVIANINFALARRGNNTKGSTIKMKNGDCDQVFSSPKKGSYMKTAKFTCYVNDEGQDVKCKSVYQGTTPSTGGYWKYKDPMTDSEYKRYEEIYEAAKNYLIIKNNDILLTEYKAPISRGWEASANAGKNFIQILKETYTDADIIECSSTSSGGDSDGDDGLDEDIGNIVAGDYRNWCQDDPKWNNNSMGASTTIGKNGCTSTSVAMAIAKSGVSTKLKNFNPATFVNWMNKNGGYIGYDKDGNVIKGNLFVWGTPAGVINGSYSASKTEFIDTNGKELMSQSAAKKYIADLLKKGLYPIVGVSRTGNCSESQGRSGHWVLADRVENGQIKVLDPGCYGSRNDNLSIFKNICEISVLDIR